MDIATLYDANLNNLTSAKAAYDALATAFGQHADAWKRDVTDRLGASHWTGTASEKAQTEVRTLGSKLQLAREELGFVSKALADAVEGFAAAQAHLVRALDDAKTQKLKVAPDGGITWDNDPASAGFAGTDAENRAKEISKRITAALNEAAHADREIEQRLSHLSYNASSGTGLDATTVQRDRDAVAARDRVPAPGSDPDDVQRWWNSLTEAQQQRFVLNHPEQVGNLDGIPAVARDQANRITLRRSQEDMKLRLAQLGPEPPMVIATMGGAVVNPQYKAWKATKDDLEEKLRAANDIESRLNGALLKKRNGEPAFLLGYDTKGKGRAIISVNNPDTADNVVTFVPGTTARFGTAIGDVDKADEMVKAARDADSSKTTAAIAWIGYDAPQDYSEAAQESYAKGAEQDLLRFQNALRTTHEGNPSHNTLMGHSYGSTTVGFTMRDHRVPVDDVILVGSPGVGVDHARELNIDPSHVYVARGGEDTGIKNTARLGWFGLDPMDQGFGATHLPAGNSDHSHYWRERSPSVKAFGSVVAGQGKVG